MSLTNQKGDVGEMAVAAKMLRLGYKVAIPYGHDWKYDLIVEVQGKLKKVQIKSATPKNGILSVKLGTNTNILKGKHVYYSYTDNDFDYFVVYDLEGDECYLIPFDIINEKQDTFSLRLEPPKNNQKKNINWAEDYVLKKL